MPRLEADREFPVTAASPSSATAIRAIALALFEAGYDGRDGQSMHQFAEDMRAWRQGRRDAERRQVSRSTWRTILWSAIATSGVAAAFQWLPSLFRLLGQHSSHGGPR